MLTDRQLVKISKFLSKHLRHTPEALGLTLEVGGWVAVETLLTACAAHGFPITRDELDEVVQHNDKQRFAFDGDGTRIRANQGHSTEVDLQLAPATPPDVLYHGTSRATAPLIREQGLLKMSRHHVHLSTVIDTARTVGARHGSPLVFAVDAARMHADGHVFYCSENGVWLVEQVPPEYLREIS
jgi:putative RNA 2'-phosphotransferase